MNTKAPDDTVYKWWSIHSLGSCCANCVKKPPPAMGARFTVFLARRPCGHAGWLTQLLMKAGDVETNVGKNWACSFPPTPHSSPITPEASDGNPFINLQFNANASGNKQVELGELVERHKVKVAMIQESKLTLNSRTPNIQNFTTVSKKNPSSRPRRWFTHIDS